MGASDLDISPRFFTVTHVEAGRGGVYDGWSMEWEPIKPHKMKGELPGVSEMEALKLVWADYREYFGPEMTKNIQDRFNREWSIETGLIEGAYYIDRGLTETLVEHGIKADLIGHQANGKSPEQVASILLDQVDAIEGLFDFVKGGSALTTSYVRQLHQQLTRSESTYTVFTPDRQPVQRPLEKGKYKMEPNSPLRPDGVIHPYCPPEQVDGEMERLVKIYYEQLGLPIEVQAAWLHHAFTQIHPFQDGNGRVARALATLVLIKGRLLPLLVFREERPAYIESLESADAGNLRPFIEYVRHCQRLSILRISESLIQPMFDSASTSATVEELISGIRTKLVMSDGLPNKDWLIDKQAEALWKILEARLSVVASLVNAELGHASHVQCNLIAGPRKPFVIAETVNITPSKGACIQLITVQQFNIHFFFGTPVRFRGLGVTAMVIGSKLPEDFFLLNYKESESDTKTRFELWLETQTKEGLKRWQDTLHN